MSEQLSGGGIAEVLDKAASGTAPDEDGDGPEGAQPSARMRGRTALRKWRVLEGYLSGLAPEENAARARVSVRQVRRYLADPEVRERVRELVEDAHDATGLVLLLAGWRSAEWIIRRLETATANGKARGSRADTFAVKVALEMIERANRLDWPSRSDPALVPVGQRVEDVVLLDWLRQRQLGPFHADPAEQHRFFLSAVMPGSPFRGALRAFDRERAVTGPKVDGADPAPGGST